MTQPIAKGITSQPLSNQVHSKSADPEGNGYTNSDGASSPWTIKAPYTLSSSVPQADKFGINIGSKLDSLFESPFTMASTQLASKGSYLSDLSSDADGDSLKTQIDAEVRKDLNLPLDATEQQVNEASKAKNDRDIRENLGLSPNATEAEVDAKLEANNNAKIRKDLGLPADATEQQVDDAEKKRNGG